MRPRVYLEIAALKSEYSEVSILAVNDLTIPLGNKMHNTVYSLQGLSAVIVTGGSSGIGAAFIEAIINLYHTPLFFNLSWKKSEFFSQMALGKPFRIRSGFRKTRGVVKILWSKVPAALSKPGLLTLP